MTKVNLSIPDELLRRIDAEAQALGLSRSGLVQEASLGYIVRSSADREAERRRLKAEAASRRLLEIGKRLGLGETDAVAEVAAARVEAAVRHGD